MSRVDAELYLRLFAERELVSGATMRPWGDPLVARARALAAAGAIEPEAAQQVIDGYGRAFALRGRGHARPHRGRSPAPRPRPGWDRIAFCAATIEQPWGEVRLRHVLLGPDGVRIAVTARPVRSARGGPSGVTVRDDRGTAVTTGFSGGGGDDEWTGHLHSDQQLAPDTAWLEVAGERVELREPLRGVEVSVRSLSGSPVERYLRHCLEGGADRHGGDDASEAVAALVGCGVLDADGPLAVGTREVAAALQGAGQHWAAPAPAATLPAPWDALLRRRGFAGGPTGTVRLGVLTPVFGGVQATLCGLESTPEGVRTGIALSGAFATRVPGEADVRSGAPTFTASDDRGNAYLGGLRDWSGGTGRIEGTLEFWPGLDPQAAALGIAITTDDAQAVIRIPLRWEQAG